MKMRTSLGKVILLTLVGLLVVWYSDALLIRERLRDFASCSVARLKGTPSGGLELLPGFSWTMEAKKLTTFSNDGFKYKYQDGFEYIATVSSKPQVDEFMAQYHSLVAQNCWVVVEKFDHQTNGFSVAYERDDAFFEFGWTDNTQWQNTQNVPSSFSLKIKTGDRLKNPVDSALY